MIIETAHRAWPVPVRPWTMFMRWYELLFMHWPVPASTLRALIPPDLELDTFEGEAWIGVVPFRMDRIHPPGLPPMPWVSAFSELNVRTYVTAKGKPGVWFFSLDAANPLAVVAARRIFHLPYFNATIRAVQTGVQTDYQSVRTHRRARRARFDATYFPVGAALPARPGSIEHFLAERYCLYAADRAGKLYRGEIAHAAWPLRPAEAEIRANEMTCQIDLKLPDVRPLLHYADSIDTVAWPLDRVQSRRV